MHIGHQGSVPAAAGSHHMDGMGVHAGAFKHILDGIVDVLQNSRTAAGCGAVVAPPEIGMDIMIILLGGSIGQGISLLVRRAP